MKAESKSFPNLSKLQGGVIVPCNVQEVSRETEDGTTETFYVYDKLKLNQKMLPNLEQAKAEIIKALNSDLQQYIYIRYDQGTQQTISAYAQKANRLGRSDIQDECEKIFDWIDSVLSYYDTQKNNIQQATDEQSMIQVIWDFDANVPMPSGLLGWRYIRDMFN